MNECEEMKVTCIEPDQQALVTLANIEYRISVHMQGTYREILAVGRCLVEAKEAGLVPHGQWEEWVRRNTGMSERQAQRLMQAARNVQTGSAMESLPISKIQVILSLPEPEREAMAEQAASEDMSLRELQEEVRRQKQLADEANERARRSEISRANTVEKLRAELAAAQQAPAAGISPEAQAEIDRLKGELADAEAYAEQQAEQRQQAQREMLAMQTQAARGELDTAGSLNSFDIAAAVRTFIGAAGVLPHMGATLAHASPAQRQEIWQYVDIDQLMEMEILLTIKYEMVLQGFNAAKQAAPQPEKPPAEEPTGKKAHRGGRKRLTMDDIDRIFEIFFTMTAEEKDLIRGLLDSDKERRAAVP